MVTMSASSCCSRGMVPAAVLLLLLSRPQPGSAAELMVYIGSGDCDDISRHCKTPTNGTDSEVWAYRYNSVSNKLTFSDTYALGGLPSWIITANNCLFATLTKGGGVASFRIARDGSKELLLGCVIL